MRVVKLLADDMALATQGTALEEISVALVEASAGTTVLVHAGEAIATAPGGAPQDSAAPRREGAG